MPGEVRVSLKELREDFDAVFARLAGAGDLVWVDAGKQRFLLVNDADVVREVLVDRSADLVKPRLQAIDTGPPGPEPPPPLPVDELRRRVTAGLADRDAAGAEAVEAAAALETAAWRDGVEVELMPMLRRVCIRSVASGAFASCLDEADVARMDAVLRWFDQAPRVLPASRFDRYALRRRQMLGELTSVAERLAANAPRDAPSELDAVAVADPGSQHALVGELLLGAVGPLVQTAAWSLLRLATEPAEAEIVRAEWPETRRTAAFVREVTRLHPTNPRVTRAAIVDTAVGGEPVPAHTRVVLNVNGICRDARYYDDPERFLPERWLDGRPHKFAYLSFGIGGRRCLGESFALAALTALLPAVGRGRRLELGDVHVTVTGRQQPAEGTRVTVRVC